MATRPYYKRELGKHFSEGSRLVWLWLEQNNVRQADLEREVRERASVSVGHLNRVLYGERPCSLEIAVALRDITGTPVEAWTQPPAEEWTPRALREEDENDATADTDPAPPAESGAGEIDHTSEGAA